MAREQLSSGSASDSQQSSDEPRTEDDDVQREEPGPGEADKISPDPEDTP